MKLRLYQKYAHYWIIIKIKKTQKGITGGLSFVTILTIAHEITETKLTNHTIVVTTRVLSNIDLHYFFGPHRNIEDPKDRATPRT